MSDRRRPAAPDAGETPILAGPSTSPQYHVGRRPLFLAVPMGAESLAGYSLIPGSSSAGSFPNAKSKAPELAASSAAPSPTAVANPAPPAMATAAATDGALVGWSLEGKVGQLMIIGVDAQAPKQFSSEAVNAYHVGNIFTAGRTTADSQATQKVISSLTSEVGPGTIHVTPVLVVTDQKGGEAQVLAGSGSSDIPSALDQSARPRDQLTALARTWGKGLAGVGVNMNLTPAAGPVDTARPVSNGPIGRWGREYEHDAVTVSSQTGAFVEEMQASKITPIYKHFPSLGWVKDNTDTSADVIDSTMTHSADTAISVTLGIAIAVGTPAITVSSATHSLIDPSASAIFSPTIIIDMLRREMGFSGVVIIDDVSAAVQIQDMSVGDQAVRAIRVGCDIVLASADPTMIADMIKALISTTRSGPTFAARVNESATRMLNLKKSLQS